MSPTPGQRGKVRSSERACTMMGRPAEYGLASRYSFLVSFLSSFLNVVLGAAVVTPFSNGPTCLKNVKLTMYFHRYQALKCLITMAFFLLLVPLPPLQSITLPRTSIPGMIVGNSLEGINITFKQEKERISELEDKRQFK